MNTDENTGESTFIDKLMDVPFGVMWPWISLNLHMVTDFWNLIWASQLTIGVQVVPVSWSWPESRVQLVIQWNFCCTRKQEIENQLLFPGCMWTEPKLHTILCYAIRQSSSINLLLVWSLHFHLLADRFLNENVSRLSDTQLHDSSLCRRQQKEK